MNACINGQPLCRDAEYNFAARDQVNFPHLWRLINRGYGLAVIQHSTHQYLPHDQSQSASGYTLACVDMGFNGSELLLRYSPMTPQYAALSSLEYHVEHNMVDIFYRHFFGRNMPSQTE